MLGKCRCIAYDSSCCVLRATKEDLRIELKVTDDLSSTGKLINEEGGSRCL